MSNIDVFLIGVVAYCIITVIAAIDHNRRKFGAKSAIKFAIWGCLPVWFGIAAIGVKWIIDFFGEVP